MKCYDRIYYRSSYSHVLGRLQREYRILIRFSVHPIWMHAVFDAQIVRLLLSSKAPFSLFNTIQDLHSRILDTNIFLVICCLGCVLAYTVKIFLRRNKLTNLLIALSAPRYTLRLSGPSHQKLREYTQRFLVSRQIALRDRLQNSRVSFVKVRRIR